MRIGMFANAGNLYYSLRKKYPGKKLNYQRFYEWVDDLGEIVNANVYISQHPRDASGFIFCLRQLGLEPKFSTIKRKNPIDVSVMMIVDILNCDAETIVIGSSDPKMVPFVEYLTQRGFKVIIFASNIGKALNEVAAQCIEIPESLLEKEEDRQARDRIREQREQQEQDETDTTEK